MNKRLSMPDGLRVIAIGLVMWFHIWQQSWLMPVKQMGNYTIDLTWQKVKQVQQKKEEKSLQAKAS